jgi:hypothetical protein
MDFQIYQAEYLEGNLLNRRVVKSCRDTSSIDRAIRPSFLFNLMISGRTGEISSATTTGICLFLPSALLLSLVFSMKSLRRGMVIFP